MSAPPEIPEAYGHALAAVSAETLAALHGLEAGFRRLHPPLVPALREKLSPARARLDRELEAFHATTPPEALAPFHEELAAAADTALDALARVLEDVPGAHPAAQFFGWGYDQDYELPVQSDLGRHVIEHMMQADFDVSHFTYLNDLYGGRVVRRYPREDGGPLAVRPEAAHNLHKMKQTFIKRGKKQWPAGRPALGRT